MSIIDQVEQLLGDNSRMPIQVKQEDAEQLVYLVMGRDEYGQYESRKGSWEVLEVYLDPEVSKARVEQLKKKDRFSGYQMVPKRVSGVVEVGE